MANSIVIGYMLKVKYEFAKLTFQLGTCYNSKIIKLSWQTQQDATQHIDYIPGQTSCPSPLLCWNFNQQHE